jgi:hypothetical protein
LHSLAARAAIGISRRAVHGVLLAPGV